MNREIAAANGPIVAPIACLIDVQRHVDEARRPGRNQGLVRTR